MLKPLGGEPLLHNGRQPAAGLLHLGVHQQPLSITPQLFIARPAGPGSQYVPNQKLDPNLSSPTMISCPFKHLPALASNDPKMAADWGGTAHNIWPRAPCR